MTSPKNKKFANLDANPECPVTIRLAIPKKPTIFIKSKANSVFFILDDYTI